jgi:hypothetical protein
MMVRAVAFWRGVVEVPEMGCRCTEPGVTMVRAVAFWRGVVEMWCRFAELGVLMLRAVGWGARCACARMSSLTRWVSGACRMARFGE